MLRLLLNIFWFLTCGVWLWIAYVVAGVIACLLVVTIPIGVASFRMANYAVWPFGRAVVAQPGAGAGSALMNVVWFLVAGWWLAIGHVTTAIAQAVTIVGIPLAVANLKLLPVTLMPFGKEVVDARLLPPGQRPLHSL
ncbi:YccF domain-containing protein [Arsenicicoccus piscis]|uniref:Inner membrane component domain-containing protein n=1 Tax=Arsenicicoccus piscis TaxID=673954 RepID=A0ABQ6HR17_9MICO|nr:YccF domain-containing protein [Arsenicicoccus piscis]MCH8628821.1 YccF domain-containing protein [Arsenicicoccus piscis]GMA20129.1 hypothetical protein GCM10025862_21500 [Arsenicicoccus piscis]